MVKEELTIYVSSYEREWIENAILRQERGQIVDDGTLATLGQLLIDSVEI